MSPYHLHGGDLFNFTQVIEFERISCIVTMVFNSNQLTCRISDALLVVQTLLWLNRVVFFKHVSLQTPLKIESTPEKVLVYPDFQPRRKNSLQIRTAARAQHQGVKRKRLPIGT
jgi:hypothetical protein